MTPVAYFVKRYALPMGTASDKPLESGVTVYTEILGMVPFLASEDGQGGLTSMPGWETASDSPLAFYPGISNEDEDPDGSPSTTPQASAYYNKMVLRTLVHPEISGTIICTNYSSDGSDSETGRFMSVYQELWGSQLEGNVGSASNESFGTVY